jgi:hypothetical protein
MATTPEELIADPRRRGEAFVVAHSPLRVRITADRLDTLFPDGTTLSGLRQTQ